MKDLSKRIIESEFLPLDPYTATKADVEDIFRFEDCHIENLEAYIWNANDEDIWKIETRNFETIKVMACLHPILPVQWISKYMGSNEIGNLTKGEAHYILNRLFNNEEGLEF